LFYYKTKKTDLQEEIEFFIKGVFIEPVVGLYHAHWAAVSRESPASAKTPNK
jgi:hypothetical protein